MQVALKLPSKEHGVRWRTRRNVSLRAKQASSICRLSSSLPSPRARGEAPKYAMLKDLVAEESRAFEPLLVSASRSK